MTRSKFTKEIIKEGNVVVRVDFRNPVLSVYKIEKTIEENDDWVEGELLYYLGWYCGDKTNFSRTKTAEIGILFSEYYIVTEEF